MRSAWDIKLVDQRRWNEYAATNGCFHVQNKLGRGHRDKVQQFMTITGAKYFIHTTTFLFLVLILMGLLGDSSCIQGLRDSVHLWLLVLV